MPWILLVFTFWLFWLASREKPKYKKSYLSTRGDGSFRTNYSPGVEKYLEFIEQEVRARLIIGPAVPEDLGAELYHPELAENWQRELSGSIAQKLKDVLGLGMYGAATVLIADATTRLLTHRVGLMTWSTGHAFEKMVATIFAIATLVWLDRRNDAVMRTQGYLDGWSDHYRRQMPQKIIS